MNLDFCEAHPSKVRLLEDVYIFGQSEVSNYFNTSTHKKC